MTVWILTTIFWFHPYLLPNGIYQTRQDCETVRSALVEIDQQEVKCTEYSVKHWNSEP